jgi:hypothetical protein
MSDLKLFRTGAGGVAEISGGAVALEKSLQTLFEANLEALLGVRFLASEFVTNTGGRMDTLGIDENNAPVVIEYKRSSSEQPPPGGPSTMRVWIKEGTTNACQEAQARRDHRQAA